MTSESGKEAPTPLLSSVTSSLMTESKAQRQQMVTKEQDRKRVVTPVPGGLPRLVPLRKGISKAVSFPASHDSRQSTMQRFKCVDLKECGEIEK